MKTKIIRKILAAVMVTATVIATPELAIASPKGEENFEISESFAEKEFLGKKRNRSDQE